MGDGGVMFTISELATAVESRLVSGHRLQQRRLRGDQGPDGRARLAAVGVDLAAPDFTSLARAFGGHGVRLGGLDRILRSSPGALARDVPTLIEVVG